MLYQLSYAHHINYLNQKCQMAHPAGLEPATTRLEGGCSIQLSYGRLSTCINNVQVQALAAAEPEGSQCLRTQHTLCSTSGRILQSRFNPRQRQIKK